ncbi:hypothetical protein JTB14_037950 [Gonioctena quinquepunctata]|nr:hypothetical protein JTB14_037950 [Gonioctena quinquepunctata]
MKTYPRTGEPAEPVHVHPMRFVEKYLPQVLQNVRQQILNLQCGQCSNGIWDTGEGSQMFSNTTASMLKRTLHFPTGQIVTIIPPRLETVCIAPKPLISIEHSEFLKPKCFTEPWVINELILPGSSRHRIGWKAPR